MEGIIMICCGFGHRVVYGENIEERIYDTMLRLVDERGVDEFMIGRNGKFDQMFAEAAKKVRLVRKVAVTLVLAYDAPDGKLDEFEKEYRAQFDNVLYPKEVMETYPRWAITCRNRWMVKHCDLVISHVAHNSGGAYQAVKYARNQGREIYNIV